MTAPTITLGIGHSVVGKTLVLNHDDKAAAITRRGRIIMLSSGLKGKKFSMRTVYMPSVRKAKFWFDLCANNIVSGWWKRPEDIVLPS
jgi:hypothetical protein